MELIPKKILKPIGVLFIACVGSVIVVALCKGQSINISNSKNEAKERTPLHSALISNKGNKLVAALGYLRPEDDILELSAPLQSVGEAPVVSKLYVKEGDRVSEGDVLMEFTNLDLIKADILTLKRSIAAIQNEINLLSSETKRYKLLVDYGVYPLSDMERRQQNVVRLTSRLEQKNSELNKAYVRLRYSKLISPASGIIVRINTLEGEKGSPNGLIEMSQSLGMEAILQVDEFNINQIKVGQDVDITSENRSFENTLSGNVSYIAKRVGERRRFSLNPSLDSDVEERIFEVHVKIDESESDAIRNLIGAKVIARIQTN